MLIQTNTVGGAAVNCSASHKTDPVHRCSSCGGAFRSQHSLCGDCRVWQSVYEATQLAVAALRASPAYGEVNSPNTRTVQRPSLTPQFVANDGLKS